MNRAIYTLSFWTMISISRKKGAHRLLLLMIAVCGATFEQAQAQYCSPTWAQSSCANGSNSDDFVDGFVMANINNSSLGCPITTPNYSNFTTNVCMSVCSGNTYAVSCTPGYYATGSDEYFAVYIDFNGNGSFEDPGEFFFLGSSNYGSTVTGNITIPAGLPTTNTRIRVLCQNVFNTAPGAFNDCGNLDALGEAIDYCITINAIPVITLGPSVTQCGGTHALDAGNSGSTYKWSDSSTNEILLARTSGIYSVTVTTPATCSASSSDQIYIKAVPVVSLGPDITQCGGIVTLDAGNPGDTYRWSPGSATTQTLRVSSNITASVTVTDPNTNCTASGAVNVTINPLPLVNLGPARVQCGGTYTIDAGNPGSGYLWSDGSTNETLVVSQSGIYRVTVTNGTSCSAAGSVSITINTQPVVNLGPDISSCGPVTLDAGNPGDNYSWSPGGATTETIIADSTHAYSVTVTNPNGGCSATGSLNVTVKPVPVVNLGPDQVQCGGSVQLNANNAGATFLWSDGSMGQTLTVSTSGTYRVTVTGASSCSATDSVMVYIKPVPVVNLGPDVTQCAGTVILDAGSPGFRYHWFNNSTNETYVASISGSYSVTVTDTASGCTGADQINVTINLLPIVNLGRDTTRCGGSVVLDAGNPGSSYLWSDGEITQQISVTTSGIYRVTVTTTAGCTASSSVTVTIHPIPVVTLNLPSTSVCYTTAPFQLQGGAPPGGNYYVDDSLRTAFDPVAQGVGTHHVEYVYSSPFGCTDSASGSITVHPQPIIMTSLPPDLCITSTPIDLNNYFSPVNGQYSGFGVSEHFLYPVLTGAVMDTITDIYTDVFGCADTSVYPIIIHNPVHVSLQTSVNSLSICKGDSVIFTALGADLYQFFVNGVSQGPATPTNVFVTKTLQNHDEITVVGSNQCSSDISEPIIFDVHDLPVVTAAPDTSIALGSTIQLRGAATGSWPFVYFWSPPTGLSLVNVASPYFNGSDTTTFTFTASDRYGCRDSAHVTINVFLPDAIVLPNVITPDGDGFNDVWKLNPKLPLDGSHLIIFNRWGESVYEVSNYANNWDGTYKNTGRKLPDGTYYYVLKVPLENNHVYRGAINILNGGAK